ncbi:MAG: rhodanese-like domain-containing protein [Sulfuriferula sp.]
MYGFKEVDAAGLETLKTAGTYVLIDVRTDAEVSRGMIDNAMHLPLHLLPIKVQGIPQDKPVVFYCQSGGRSAQACAFLAAKGFENVYNLQGGIMGWMRSGKPLAAMA